MPKSCCLYPAGLVRAQDQSRVENGMAMWICSEVVNLLCHGIGASLRPAPLHGLRSRLVLSSIPRTTSALGCIQSLLPLHSVVAAARLTSHIAVQASICCELSQGIGILN
ncbi:uncharacterized protein LOC127786960 isoform X2 [Diospyros lotus]|uniref:uncharacterized protein LOC127786960 isoform X2 n=1 Tax=Diospyros lotus TaxID=55363 RepID=UPI0022572D88|nr:uncharacterized protein LOC127786960 isoform X2 [Diospyros lotus]